MPVDRWYVVAGDLTDQDWARLEPLLPPMAPQRGGRWRDHRQVINGILWRIDNGARWDQILDRYGPAKTLLRPVRPLGAGRHLGADRETAAGRCGRSRRSRLARPD